MAIQLSNTAAGGQGMSCSGGTLGMTAGSKARHGGFNASYLGLGGTGRAAAPPS